MNGSEQKNHRTVTATIAQNVEAIASATASRLSILERQIGDERTHCLKLADEQRGYVDARDRELRDCCQQRWDDTSATNKHVFGALAALRDRGFWGRVNWLLTGR